MIEVTEYNGRKQGNITIGPVRMTPPGQQGALLVGEATNYDQIPQGPHIGRSASIELHANQDGAYVLQIGGQYAAVMEEKVGRDSGRSYLTGKTDSGATLWIFELTNETGAWMMEGYTHFVKASFPVPPEGLPQTQRKANGQTPNPAQGGFFARRSQQTGQAPQAAVPSAPPAPAPGGAAGGGGAPQGNSQGWPGKESRPFGPAGQQQQQRDDFGEGPF